MQRSIAILALLAGCAGSVQDAADVSGGSTDEDTAAVQNRCGGGVRATADGPRRRGVVVYRKQLSQDGEVELRPVRHAPIMSGNIAVGLTDASGCFDVPDVDGLRVEARAALTHFDVEVRQDTVWSWPVDRDEVVVSERYAAGAFNVLDGAALVDESLDGALPAEARGAPLVVRWGARVNPACGSCFYVNSFTLELTGVAGDEDAHDDAVFLHEFGHYVEAAFGTWSNPGGGHDLEAAVPTMAWSEGFATWYQAALRDTPDYVDYQSGRIYQLDLEQPPLAVFGTIPEGDPAGRVSEGLVFGLLWDLIDAGPNDDDEVSLPVTQILVGAVGILGTDAAPLVDAGYLGADLVDALRRLGCGASQPTVRAVAEAFEFPWTDGLCGGL